MRFDQVVAALVVVFLVEMVLALGLGLEDC